MTGLEKLVLHIKDDADTAAKAVISEAIKKADEILASAKAEGERKSAEIMQQSKLDVQASLSRADSAALLQEKRLLLNAKQQMIENILSVAKEKLVKLPDSEYFDVIINMIIKYSLCQLGQILFSQTDKARLPNMFEERIMASLSKKQGAALKISAQTRDIDGGFVLIYGDVEENCSFEALFFAAKESLQDKVTALLFS